MSTGASLWAISAAAAAAIAVAALIDWRDAIARAMVMLAQWIGARRAAVGISGLAALGGILGLVQVLLAAQAGVAETAHGAMLGAAAFFSLRDLLRGIRPSATVDELVEQLGVGNVAADPAEIVYTLTHLVAWRLANGNPEIGFAGG